MSIEYGESTTRAGLPDEVLLRVMKRADAEQNRHVSLVRIADALGNEHSPAPMAFQSIAVFLGRIADALDRAYPKPPPEEMQYTADGLPVPPWLGGESGTGHDDTATPESGHDGA